ncbi:hypothetical protein, partial [Streptomyces pseudogriseolus]|uniref:hypothetical protein n=1 Tax=Streptomyces pseudogriseolus TaxID=36817 RepID=UPI003F9FA116
DLTRAPAARRGHGVRVAERAHRDSGARVAASHLGHAFPPPLFTHPARLFEKAPRMPEQGAWSAFSF